MRNPFDNEKVLADCKIYQMLSAAARGRHLSFHTPGHKVGAWDITELSFSDNLASPRGCIREAEQDIAQILGAKRSFILTDGSTSGVLAMLYAAKRLGVRKIAVCEGSHKSVFNGCKLMGITPLVYPQEKKWKIPYEPTVYELSERYGEILQEADALFLTSPNYYGGVADLAGARTFCDENKKLLLIDGAHGGHLHFEKTLHAGSVADMWVDGVHKSLPALTQGAVVSAREDETAEALAEGVGIFRTTSPSYPVMASVEYAVKYPRNEELETLVRAYADGQERVIVGKDWTKVCVLFGEYAFEAEKALEKEGVYAEFCDGNVVTFYLSPATEIAEFEELKEILSRLFIRYPHWKTEEEKEVQSAPAPFLLEKNGKTEKVDLTQAVGRICAELCGLFPPCTPLLRIGERITEEKVELLAKADNVFGLADGKISVYIEE